MKEYILISGGIYGGLSVVIGAFAAHALKNRLTEYQINSFETGVKYQMYHALMLILIGIIFPFTETSQVIMGWCFILGTLLFSFSIYALILSSSAGRKLPFLGPVTPLGGMLLVAGWSLFIWNIIMF